MPSPSICPLSSLSVISCAASDVELKGCPVTLLCISSGSSVTLGTFLTMPPFAKVTLLGSFFLFLPEDTPPKLTVGTTSSLYVPLALALRFFLVPSPKITS